MEDKIPEERASEVLGWINIVRKSEKKYSGRVDDTRYLVTADNSPTFLNMGGVAYSNIGR